MSCWYRVIEFNCGIQVCEEILVLQMVRLVENENECCTGCGNNEELLRFLSITEVHAEFW